MMATQTQTMTPPCDTHAHHHVHSHSHSHSPHTKSVRKRLSYISPRNVVSIITPRRHSSHADFSTPTSSSSSPPAHQQKKQRTVSTPIVQRMASSSSKTSDDDVEMQEITSMNGDAVAVNASASSAAASASANSSNSGTSVTRRAATAVVHPAQSLSFPHVADLFVRLRRAQRKAKAHHIDSSSGEEPITHESLRPGLNPLTSEGNSQELAQTQSALVRRARLEVQEAFVCLDAVDLRKLLRATRTGLLESAEVFGADVLAEEQWFSSICEPKHRSDGTYRVHVRYVATACAATAATPGSTSSGSRPSSSLPRPLRDPHQPVALERVQDKAGLMTILSRDLVSVNVLDVFLGEAPAVQVQAQGQAEAETKFQEES